MPPQDKLALKSVSNHALRHPAVVSTGLAGWCLITFLRSGTTITVSYGEQRLGITVHCHRSFWLN